MGRYPSVHFAAAGSGDEAAQPDTFSAGDGSPGTFLETSRLRQIGRLGTGGLGKLFHVEQLSDGFWVKLPPNELL